MTSIVALRAELNALILRHTICRDAVTEIMAQDCVFTAVMAKNQCKDWRECGDDEEESLAFELVGKRLPVFNDHVLNSLFDQTYEASNIMYYKRELESLIQPLYEPNTNTVEPSREGWSDHEYDTLVRSYKTKIAKLRGVLTSINENVVKIFENRSMMPKWIKQTAMGLFGQPDLLTEYTYSDSDFRWPQGFKRQDLPQVFTVRWLAPIFGVDVARNIHNALDVLVFASTPNAD